MGESDVTACKFRQFLRFTRAGVDARGLVHTVKEPLLFLIQQASVPE